MMNRDRDGARECEPCTTSLPIDFIPETLVFHSKPIVLNLETMGFISKPVDFHFITMVHDFELIVLDFKTMAQDFELIVFIFKTTVFNLESVASVPSARVMPADARGANVYSYVGAIPPLDITQWTFKGQPTRTQFEVEFPNDVTPGTKVWFTAAWYNPRGELGALVAPVSTYTQFGGLSAAASGEEGENVKIAA